MVEGKRIKAGKSICIADAAIIDSEGKYLAHGTSRQMVIPGLQAIIQAVSAMGYKPLPPKFIVETPILKVNNLKVTIGLAELVS